MGEFVDPFQTPGAGLSSVTQSPLPPPHHWTLDSRLNGEEFFVKWKPAQGMAMAKVVEIREA
jgi:hypothetical protein